MLKIVFRLIFIMIFLSLWTCSSPQQKIVTPGVKEVPHPAGLTENILDENNDPVSIYENEGAFLTKKSSDPEEFFRVVINSESYIIRQIRGTEQITRKVDKGGDKLISEDLKKYDMMDFADEGVVNIKLSPKHGTISELHFMFRAPRINELAKIMQNDATRWVINQKNEDKKILQFNIHYQIVLKNNNADREKIKENLKKEVQR